MTVQFNTLSERPRFIFKPKGERVYEIFQRPYGAEGYNAVGDYRVVDSEEPSALTEKKLENLMALMNGRKGGQNLSAEVSTRTFYHVVPKSTHSDPTRVILRDYTGAGVSQDNAIFTIERGIFQ